MIAFRLRETLETPGKTAALVTPDRTLARMVSAECARYHITLDDSAGSPLAATPPALFMSLLLEGSGKAGLRRPSLLALLRHPLAAGGSIPADCREMSRALETECWRNIRLEPGMDALLASARTKRLPPPIMPMAGAHPRCASPARNALFAA